jgi:hypothetical protein
MVASSSDSSATREATIQYRAEKPSAERFSSLHFYQASGDGGAAHEQGAFEDSLRHHIIPTTMRHRRRRARQDKAIGAPQAENLAIASDLACLWRADGLAVAKQNPPAAARQNEEAQGGISGSLFVLAAAAPRPQPAAAPGYTTSLSRLLRRGRCGLGGGGQCRIRLTCRRRPGILGALGRGRPWLTLLNALVAEGSPTTHDADAASAQLQTAKAVEGGI